MKPSWESCARPPALASSGVYREVWRVSALSLGLAAALASVTVADPATTVTIFVTLLFMSGPLSGILVLDHTMPLRSVPGATVSGVLVLTSFYPLGELIGAWCVLAVPAVALTAPRLVTTARARGRSGAGTSSLPTLRELLAARSWEEAEADDASTEVLLPPANEVERLSTRQLCRVWRRSTEELAGARSQLRAVELVALRAVCLEEMWRRDESGCRRWMQVGAHAADPSGYVRHGGLDTGADM